MQNPSPKNNIYYIIKTGTGLFYGAVVMDLEKYLREINTQRQLDKLAKKCSGKKILIYGAGSFFELICKSYDISKLNIVAISDLKFANDTSLNNTRYRAIKPDEIKEFDCDVIVVALLNDLSVAKSIEKNILKGSKNAKVPIVPMLSPTFKYLLKLYFEKV